MAITVGTNVNSLRVQRRLAATTNAVEQVYERLSSGSRINRAADDAAGLAVAESLRTQQRIAQVAIRNANDGISLIAIADGAMSEISGILQRLAELAEQSANGTYSAADRSAMQLEFTALGSEVERISRITRFNDVALLSNTANVVLQVGLDGTVNSTLTINSVSATLASLGLATSGSSALTFSISGATTVAAQSAARLALEAVTAAISSLNISRGSLGGIESRLSAAVNLLQNSRLTMSLAESRIRDADVAVESAELIRLTILQQAGAAILAQANQEPSVVLTLLSGR